jgi:hypothetical protein
MIRKSVKRFSEKIMPNKRPKRVIAPRQIATSGRGGGRDFFGATIGSATIE